MSLQETLRLHDLWRQGNPEGKRADLYQANLYGADLRGANLFGANLRGANLFGADLGGADLYGADLNGADLYGADLNGADLGGADLNGADLGGADLYGADLGGADLGGAHFADSNLSCSKGVLWCQFGPIGTDRRTLTAVWHGPDEGLILHAGCFRGTIDEYLIIVDGRDGIPWDWPEHRVPELQAESHAVVAVLQASINAQLSNPRGKRANRIKPKNVVDRL